VAAPAGPTVKIDFPENEELKTIIDYVSRRVNVRIVYDEKIGGKKVTIRSPVEIPVSSLMDLLRSLLAYKGLAIRTTMDGWFEIVPADDAVRTAALAPAGTKLTGEDGTIVTRVFRVPTADLAKAQALMKTYLTGMGGKSMFSDSLGDQTVVVVTDYVGSLAKLEALLAELKTRPTSVELETYRPMSLRPSEAARRLQELLTQQYKVLGTDAVAHPLQMTPQDDVGAIILMGAREEVERAKGLLPLVDRSDPAATFQVELVHIPARQAQGLMNEHLKGVLATERLQTSVLEHRNSLLITATPRAEKAIREFLRQVDQVSPEGAGSAALAEGVRGIRFYKIRNAEPEGVARTLSELLGGGTLVSLEAAERQQQAEAAVGEAPAEPGAADTNRINRMQPRADAPYGAEPTFRSFGGREEMGPTYQTRLGPRITVDLNTGSLIISATRAEHQQLAELIEKLDHRRPQVLVEAIFVEITEADSLNLAVELESAVLGVSTGHLAFTSFGLSTINTATGMRTILPGPGFNGAVVRPDQVPIILQALAHTNRAKIRSAPRILVNDNGEARIESVEEQPFTSVNASTTVATTSFAGFAQAGTQFQIKPHISEDSHLYLKFDLTLNSFTGAGTPTTPPPRSTQSMSSDVTIPDGYTVIVGGLSRRDKSTSVDKVPLLGDIPLLGLLFQARSDTASKTTLLAFIRPVILRDENFLDLMRLSETERSAAGEDVSLPPSRPMWMHPEPCAAAPS